MEKKYIKGEIQQKGDDITIVASDETLDRHGDVIPVESWDLKNFKANPILLLDHWHEVENIVGLAKNLKLHKGTSNKLTFQPFFHELTEKSKTVAKMVKEGVLNSVSVGFIPHAPEKDGDTPKNELIEISFVTVPANPSARIESQYAKSLETKPSDEEKNAVKRFLDKTTKQLDDEELPEDDEQPDEVVEDSYDENSGVDTIGNDNHDFDTKDNEVEDPPEAEDDIEDEKEYKLDGKTIKHLKRCEKQLTALTQRKSRNQVDAQVLERALKEVAKNVNYALYKNNSLKD